MKEGIHERCRRQNGSAKSCRFLFALRLTRKGRPVFLPPRKALINIVIQCLGEDHRFKEVFSPRVTANRIAKYGLLRIRKKCPAFICSRLSSCARFSAARRPYSRLFVVLRS